MKGDRQNKSFFVKICIYIFFTSLIFESSLWILYLAQLGYSISTIAIIQIFYSVSLLCFEYLSGFLADKFGRKRMLIIANLFICIYTIMMLFANLIYLVFFAYFIYAFAVAVISSVDQSLVYDNLNEKQKNKFLKFSSIMQCVSTMAFFIQDSISGQMVTWLSWYWLFYLTCATHVIAVIILLLIKDKHQVIIESTSLNLRSSLKKEFKFKKELYILITLFAFLQGSISIMFIYGQVILVNFKLSTSQISIVYAITNLVGVLALVTFSLIKKLNWNILSGFMLISAGIFSIFFETNNVFFFISIFVFLDLTLTIVFTHLMDIINRLIISKTRATILAIMNVSSSITMISFQIIFVLNDSPKFIRTSIFIFIMVSMAISIFLYAIFLFFFSVSKNDKIKNLTIKIKKMKKLELSRNHIKIEKYQNYIEYLNEENGEDNVDKSKSLK